MKKQPAVYMMTSRYRGTLYIGVTSRLVYRVYEHKNEGVQGSFTQKYKCKMLVYYELFETMTEAISREKQLKGGSRQRKIELIERDNPEWRDLYELIF